MCIFHRNWLRFCFFFSLNRWIKFEEDVEEGGNRWSKPHVATLSLHSLFELRSLVLNGTVMLDTEAHSLEQITDLMLESMINYSVVNYDVKDKVCTKGKTHIFKISFKTGWGFFDRWRRWYLKFCDHFRKQLNEINFTVRT